MPFALTLARFPRVLPLLLLSVGCNQLFAKDAPAPPAPDEPEKTETAPEGAAHAEGNPLAPAPQGRYAVPFAWESSPEEPLARARTFMGEVLTANDAFTKQGSGHFTPMLEQERPRATVLTCADSRVQPSAWDATPENDDYTVRNLGNQLTTAVGSVQYGVEQLHTPVLLIIGHTGCQAVKTALDKVKGKDPIAEELAHLKLPERRRGPEAQGWDTLTLAVVSNVDAQVADAVARFAPLVQSGDLTVIGAVYDLADAFDQGHGRLRLVNVNGNVEVERVEAFQKAIQETAKPKARPLGMRRSMSDERPAPIVDSMGRPLPGGPRAVINAVNVVGGGSLEAIATGTLRSTPGSGSIIAGTSDLKRAPGDRSSRSAPAPAEHAPEPHGAAGTHAKPETRGAAPAGHAPGAAPGQH